MDFDQPGMFTRADALAAGYTDDDLRRSRADRTLLSIRRGYFVRSAVYRTLDSSAQHLLLANAVLLDSADDAVLSHVSAAVLHGMPVWGIALDKACLTIGRSYASKRGRRRTLHGTRLLDSDRMIIDGVPVTVAARTVVDLARAEGVEQAVCVGDHALHSGLTTAFELAEAVDNATGRTGVGHARHAVGLMSSRSESVGESRSRLLFHNLGLPTPWLTQWVYDASGAFLGRVDFLFPEGVIGEFDGEGKYESNPVRAVIDEKNRQNRLHDLGWVVVRWDWRDLSKPDVLAERLHGAFRRAAANGAPIGTYRSDRLP